MGIKIGEDTFYNRSWRIYTILFSYYIGIAFPCCISVNNCICHYSPLTHDADTVLKAGDLAKIDLGAHIDGFIAVVAHTGKK